MFITVKLDLLTRWPFSFAPWTLISCLSLTKRQNWSFVRAFICFVGNCPHFLAGWPFSLPNISMTRGCIARKTRCKMIFISWPVDLFFSSSLTVALCWAGFVSCARFDSKVRQKFCIAAFPCSTLHSRIQTPAIHWCILVFNAAFPYYNPCNCIDRPYLILVVSSSWIQLSDIKKTLPIDSFRDYDVDTVTMWENWMTSE